MSLVCVVVTVSQLASAEPTTDQLIRTLGEQIQQAWYRDRDTKAWLLADGVTDGMNPAKCSKTLAALHAARVPNRSMIELDADSRDLRKGRHALPAAEHACARIERQGKVKMFEDRATLAAEGIGGIKVYEQCAATFKEIVAAGIPATERVPERKLYINSEEVMWTGTIEELRVRHCDGPLNKALAQRAVEEAPYRKLLKNDKLELALSSSVGYTLIGGRTTRDPGQLAVAGVWFDALSDLAGNESCPGGVKRKTLRRYAFDKQHTLVKKTQQEFCGQIPTSAFR